MGFTNQRMVYATTQSNGDILDQLFYGLWWVFIHLMILMDVHGSYKPTMVTCLYFSEIEAGKKEVYYKSTHGPTAPRIGV